MDRVIEAISLLPTNKQFTTKEMAELIGVPMPNNPNLLNTLHEMNCVNPVEPPKPGKQTVWKKTFDPNDHIFSLRSKLGGFCSTCKYKEKRRRQYECIILDRYRKGRLVCLEARSSLNESEQSPVGK